jgi:tRNA(Arg) A34 adenosine deaminase TadA
MRLAIDLAHRNVAAGTGGPFGAAVFDLAASRLISIGVNLVVTTGYSMAHAEVVAITLAQDTLGCFDLGDASLPTLQLVTSAEPCSMCLGAIHWAGLRSIACGARDEDVRSIGFDEGHKPADWCERLEASGIAVHRDVERPLAAAVLQRYRDGGGIIY